MIEHVRELDPSRPITAAVSGGILNDDCIAAEVEVMGINYQVQTYDAFHAKRPSVPIVAAETHCALSTRGEYQTDPARFIFNSYDLEKAFWGNTARQTWRTVSSRPFVAGLFAWTGFDYRGEPSPHEWPCINTHWGILDTCGFPKDSFYLHKAWFTREPFVHLLPHWNWPGREGEEILVAAYTNCDAVELFLNDESLGRKVVDPIEMVEWRVPYRVGILRAVAFREGVAAAQANRETTNGAVALALVGVESAPADGVFAIPITVMAIDDTSRPVPTAANHVAFTIEGPAKILGVGNGDPRSHEPDKASARSLFNGLAQVIIQTTSTPGQIVLHASAKGLRPASLCIDSMPACPRPSLGPAIVQHLISDWRMSVIAAERPDPNKSIDDTDMNSWERIDPARGPQTAWNTGTGYSIYRATFTPPKIFQTTGGRIVFQAVAGEAEVWINGVIVHQKPNSDPAEGRNLHSHQRRTS